MRCSIGKTDQFVPGLPDHQASTQRTTCNRVNCKRHSAKYSSRLPSFWFTVLALLLGIQRSAQEKQHRFRAALKSVLEPEVFNLLVHFFAQRDHDSRFVSWQLSHPITGYKSSAPFSSEKELTFISATLILLICRCVGATPKSATEGGDPVPTELRRISIAVPVDLEAKLTDLKRREFFGDTWSEMVRRLLEAGMREYALETAPATKT